jgi:hypothetical protein
MLCGSCEPACRNPSAKEVRRLNRRVARCAEAGSGQEKVDVIRVKADGCTRGGWTRHRCGGGSLATVVGIEGDMPELTISCVQAIGSTRSCWPPPNPPCRPREKPPHQPATQGRTTRFGNRRQSIPCLHRTKPLNTKGVEIMAHCRYCNRFRLTRLAGRGAWLLECGHTYLPLPSEAQTWAAYTRDPRPAA